jgi:hypothetical protein
VWSDGNESESERERARERERESERERERERVRVYQERNHNVPGQEKKEQQPQGRELLEKVFLCVRARVESLCIHCEHACLVPVKVAGGRLRDVAGGGG